MERITDGPERAANDWGKEDREFRSIVRRVDRRERAAGRVRTLGAVYTVLSGLAVVAAALAFAAIAPWGLLSGDPTATWLLGGLGSLVAGSLLVFALPGLAAGVGLLQLRSWSRPLALVLGVVALFWVPLGTALGIATLAILLDDASTAVFQRSSGPPTWRATGPALRRGATTG